MNVLVAVDFSPVIERQLRVVGRVCAGADVVVLHVAEPNPAFVGFEGGPGEVRDQIAAEFREEHRAVQALADRLRNDGIDATALLVQGPTAATILEQARRAESDVIVVGSHGRSAVYDLIAGSVSAEVIRKSDVPVLVVPSR